MKNIVLVLSFLLIASFAYAENEEKYEKWTRYRAGRNQERSYLQVRGTFVDGKKEGLWEMFDRDGKTIRKVIFEKGRIKEVIIDYAEPESIVWPHNRNQ